jgi:Uri superfamily endonuclease
MTAPGHPTKLSADPNYITMPIIPAIQGTYYLHLKLSAPRKIEVGRFGFFRFEGGHYIYCGSAMGPGGLGARLSRHLTGNGKQHWHIDWLRQEAEVVGYGFHAGTSKMECEWSHTLAERLDAVIPVPGFGASDCESGCMAHLIYFRDEPKLENEVKWGNVNVWRII